MDGLSDNVKVEASRATTSEEPEEAHARSRIADRISDSSRSSGGPSRSTHYAREEGHGEVEQGDGLHQNSTTRTNLWSAVRSSLQAASAFRLPSTLADSSSRRQASARTNEADEDGLVDAYEGTWIDEEGLSTTQDGLWASVGSLPARGSRRRGATKERRAASKTRVVSGTHIDQWQNIAHLFDNDDDDVKSETQRNESGPLRRGAQHGRGSDRSKRRSMPDIRQDESAQLPSAKPSDMEETRTLETQQRSTETEGERRRSTRQHTQWKGFGLPPRADTFETTFNRESITSEPESWIDANPDTIPRNEDPLAYAEDQDKLLETDSDTESESDTSWDNGVEGDRSQLSTKAHDQANSTWSWLQHQVHVFTYPSPVTKTIIKCVAAYFLASLFTFSPFLSSRMATLLPNQDPESPKIVPISNLHMIATVAVYFHPGRSIGSMIEANVFAFASFSYAILLGLTSMLTAVFLHDQSVPGFSNVITVVVFVGLNVALVGYAKIKVAKPSFNTACSLISVIIFTVIVKEGSAHLGHYSTDKIWQVTLVVIAGVIVANIVCFALWPMSATSSLQGDIQRNLQSFATLLKVLTKTFLLDDITEFNVRSDRLIRACDNHHTSFVSLKKNLAEAKLEAPFDRRMRGKVSNYVVVVDSLNRLAQHLGGLRSSCSLQHEIIVAQRLRRKGQPRTQEGQDVSLGENVKADVDNSAFENFLGSVGPHMRSLVVSPT